MIRTLTAAVLPLLCLVVAPHIASGQDESSISIFDGVFTEAQVERGKVTYEDQCATCHGYDLVSQAGAPHMVMPSFRYGWHGRTIAQKLEQIRTTMPQGFPESMSDQEYLEVIAYILDFNGYPTGDRELDADQPEILDKITVEPLP